MTTCEVESIADGKRWRCPICDRPARMPLGTPVRECMGAPPTPLTYNDLESGPCLHLGPILRTVGCELCGKRDKLVQIHACNHPEKQGHEVTQDRYSPRQFRTDVCRTCKLFPIATAPGRILGHDEPPAAVEKADRAADEGGR